MLPPDIPNSDIQKIIMRLDQALYNHKRWYRLLVRSLVCHTPCEQHNLTPDAHKNCRFGQWYYNYVDHALLEHSRFIAIGKEHKHMHDLARELLKNQINDAEVSTHKYDNFADSLDYFQVEISSLKQELEQLIHYRDELTNAINRSYMLPTLHEQHELIKRHIYPATCIVMMDLDYFSEVNNKYGHAAGDKTLATITRYILSHLRTYDKIFRYGGEEFLFLFQDTEIEKGIKLVERLKAGIANLTIDIAPNKSIHITASFGIAPLTAEQSVKHAIEQADKAMYAAKSEGRNRICIAK